jgi:hypothetical protein
VTLFLLTFDRKSHTTTVEEIGDDGVLERLFEAERIVRGNPGTEVVLLTAADEDDLRQTHSRYFESVDELLTR